MLRRYSIIALVELRRAGNKSSDYRGPKESVRPLRDGRGDGSVTVGA
jgi:hypothetical protein